MAETLELLARYRRPRPADESIDLLVMHKSGANRSTAAAVAKYCQRLSILRRGSKGGYHELCDDRTLVIGARDDEVVNGAAGANDNGWHLCIPGANEHLDDWFRRALELAAPRFASRCLAHTIPARRPSVLELKGGSARGIVGHVDVSHAWHLTDHTDPGDLFAWEAFLSLVRINLTEAAPTPEVAMLLDGYWRALPLPGARVPAFQGRCPIVAVRPVNAAWTEVELAGFFGAAIALDGFTNAYGVSSGRIGPLQGGVFDVGLSDPRNLVLVCRDGGTIDVPVRVG